MTTAAQSETTAPELPGFRFVRHLGTGGYSQVYLYEQHMPKRNVAVKVLNDTNLSEQALQQFTAEANAMAGLADHPHIVQVFHADVTADGQPYLVMQFYAQPNLSVRARREHFSVADVLRVGIQIGSAVETAHRNGILHRDIKPHNILTGQFGSVALTDFGIATTKGADDGGAEGMSVPWSPPEVLYGTSDADERSDVYSLGATLWHLLAGRSPFEVAGGDNSTLGLMRRIQNDAPPPTGRGDVPESLERLLRQALAKDPAARPQSALAFIRSLQSVEQELRLPLTPIVVSVEEQQPAVGDEENDGDATRIRSARRIEAQPPRPPSAPVTPPPVVADEPLEATVQPDGDNTRIRALRRIEPTGDPLAAAQAPRQRNIPEPPQDVTTRRPVAPSTDVDEATPASSKPRNKLLPAVAALIVVVAAVGTGVALSGRGASKQAAEESAPTSTDDSALGPGATAPGTPAVTISADGQLRVRVNWTYDVAVPSGLFQWRVPGGNPHTARRPLVLARKAGKPVCVEVRVIRAAGAEASPWSDGVCGP
jgi:serine/threonine protein kinase